MRWRDPLRPIAEFADPAAADDAWGRLQEVGIPASVITDPDVLGQDAVTRVWVAKSQIEEAQRAIADLMR